MREEWRPVEEGVYEVSSLGCVRRAVPGQGTWVGRILKPALHGRKRPDGTIDGYWRVSVTIGGKRKWKLVHVLVALAFLGPCPPGKEVNHKDGVKTNCKWTNLEYKTSSGNAQHAYDTGLRRAHPSPGSRNGMAKITFKKAQEIRKLYKTGMYFQHDLGRMFGLSGATVGQIVRNENWLVDS
jgi:hypothetical protein